MGVPPRWPGRQTGYILPRRRRDRILRWMLLARMCQMSSRNESQFPVLDGEDRRQPGSRRAHEPETPTKRVSGTAGVGTRADGRRRWSMVVATATSLGVAEDREWQSRVGRLE